MQYYLLALAAVIIIMVSIGYCLYRRRHCELFTENNPFQNKVVVITGSTRGIGFAIATHALAQGAEAVIINGRSHESVNIAVNLLSNNKNKGIVDKYVADVSNIDKCKEFITYVYKTYGRVDILINNAVFVGTKTEDWEHELNTNVSGPLYLTRAALLIGPVQVVNIGSGAADIDGQTALENKINGSYIVSKAALNKLTNVLGAEAELKSSVTCLQINGTLDTDLTKAHNMSKSATVQMKQVLDALDKLLMKPRVETNGKVLLMSELNSQNDSEALITRAVALDIVGGVQQFIDANVEYTSISDTQDLILLSGTNPLGTSATVDTDMSDYPSKDKENQLINKIADITDTPPASICLFPGTLASIEAIARTMCKPGAKIIYGAPGWPPFIQHMRSRGYNLVEVPYTINNDDGGRSMLTLIAEKIATFTGPLIVYLSSPQYPTGTSIGKDIITKFMKAIPIDVTVIIDQCYIEYAKSGAFDASKEIQRYPNLVVTRSLSKFYGLASLRLAYTISNPLVTLALTHHVSNPFLNKYIVDASLSTLGDTDYHERVYKHNAKERARVIKELDALTDVKTISDSNFVLAKVPEATTIDDISSRLKDAGYMTQQSRLYFNDKYYLIVLQTKDANDAQIRAIYHDRKK
jgi:histidinol-phosphate aminotransferase